MASHPIESALPLTQPLACPAQHQDAPATTTNSLCTKPSSDTNTMSAPAPWTCWDDLGKPTLRGIRKCPHCGIYNGTRSLSCKNKACGAIFRGPVSTAASRRPAKKVAGVGSPEVVRLVTSGGGGGGGEGEGNAYVDVGALDGGASSSSSLSSPPLPSSPPSSTSSPAGGRQVFSLRHRCRGPEQRGFVQLTLTDTAIATTEGTLLTRLSLGHCFLPACRRQQRQQQQQQKDNQPGATASSSSTTPPPPSSSSASSSSPPQAPDMPCCDHVRQAMECPAEQVAKPLPLKSSVLDALPVTAHARQELWRLATDPAANEGGPLVQRVSRTSLVVRCDRSEAQPLGLLHCTVCKGGGGGGGGGGATRGVVKSDRASGGGGGGTQPKGEGAGASGAPTWPIFRCTCQQGAGVGSGSRAGGGGGGGGGVGSLAALGSQVSPEAFSLSVGAGSRCLHFYACVWAFASDDKLSAEFAHLFNHTSTTNGLQMILGSSAPVGASEGKAAPEPVLSIFLTRPVNEAPSKAKRLKAEEPIAAGGSQPVDEAHATLPFQQWLASVNEKIHQSMHYQFDGKPEPLVFHIPQSFFNALQQRLSLGSKKRRLPNFTTTFVRQDAPPLGTFSKYTWHITNLMHVKQIFHTPEFPLKLSQSFVRNSDGSYSPFSCPEVPVEPLAEALGRTTHAIRPLELHTFLKVGISSPEQKEPTPFIIEWIPDILPRCRVGELRLRFEYGHQPSSQPADP